MTRLSLLILLLTVVYSWEELKYVIGLFWSKLRKQKHNRQNNFANDALVADVVLIAMVPVTLAYLILAPGSLLEKLLRLLLQMIVAGLIFKAVEKFERRHKLGHQSFSVASLISPTVHFAARGAGSTLRLGRYLFVFSLPLVSGVALSLAVHRFGMEEFVERLDLLIAIAVVGLTLNITIEILERIFRSHRFHLGMLMRIILGIALILILNLQH
jgi:undecaprenyl pyrophosphate phosphatase UppP